MSRGLFWTITLLTLAIGLSLLLYLLFNVAPMDERGAMDVAAVGLFFLGLGLAAAGFGSATARILHRQWPALAGAPGGTPATTAALRQGFLFAVALLALAGLAIAQQLDIAFIVVTLIMVGLTEAFIQSRIE
jgi:hypothetical protein